MNKLLLALIVLLGAQQISYAGIAGSSCSPFSDIAINGYSCERQSTGQWVWVNSF